MGKDIHTPNRYIARNRDLYACVRAWMYVTWRGIRVTARDGLHGGDERGFVRLRAGGCDPDEPSQWTVSLETTRQYPALRVASIVRYTSRPTHPEARRWEHRASGSVSRRCDYEGMLAFMHHQSSSRDSSERVVARKMKHLQSRTLKDKNRLKFFRSMVPACFFFAISNQVIEKHFDKFRNLH